MVTSERETDIASIKPKGRKEMTNGFVISGDFLNSDKLKLLESLPAGDETIVIFFKLMGLACKANAGGLLIVDKRLPYNDEMLSVLLNRPLPRVRHALNTLIQFGMIEESGEGYKIENFIDWLIPEDRQREMTRIRVQKHREKQAALPQPQTEQQEQEQPKGKKGRVYTEEDIEMKLAKYLFLKMRENNPEAKEPNFQSWSNDVRLMMERDNRTVDHIKNMIDWSQNDSFWKANILSVKKLREKYDQMKVKAMAEHERNNVQGRGGRRENPEDIINRLLQGGQNNDISTGFIGD